MPFTKNFVSVKIYRYGEMPELTKELVYVHKASGRTFYVPKGFKTDFASIPRIFWNIIAPIGKHTLPSVLHDYLYEYGASLGISRKEADKIFWDAMIDSHVAQITANVMWFCVRVFAKSRYNTRNDLLSLDDNAMSRKVLEELK